LLQLVVVDFTATWCGPCQRIKPIYESYAQTYTGASFYKVDVDDASEIAEHYNIQAMPTFMFFKSGSKLDEVTGANERKLEELIKSLI
jgi:thioredoxin 1